MPLTPTSSCQAALPVIAFALPGTSAASAAFSKRLEAEEMRAPAAWRWSRRHGGCRAHGGSARARLRAVTSMASKSFFTDTAPKPSMFSSLVSDSSCRFFSVKMSAGVRIFSAGSSALKKNSICFSPSPSMSNALRETKCLMRSTACAGQISPPVQRRTASPSSRTAWLPQTGQRSGKHVGHWQSAGRFSGTMSRICGMTSPARWMITVSPTRMSCPSRIGSPLLPMPLM